MTDKNIQLHWIHNGFDGFRCVEIPRIMYYPDSPEPIWAECVGTGIYHRTVPYGHLDKAVMDLVDDPEFRAQLKKVVYKGRDVVLCTDCRHWEDDAQEGDCPCTHCILPSTKEDALVVLQNFREWEEEDEEENEEDED